jgi:hypothetical protein
MAQRVRKYFVRYGGEFCANSHTGVVNTPAYNGEHYCSDETHPGPPYKSGGPLVVVKKKVHFYRSKPFYAFYNSTLGWYDGYMCARAYIPPVEPSPMSISGWGAKGWSRTQPMHPIYSLGVSVGELKDLPGMVKQTLQGFRYLRSFAQSFRGTGPKTVRDVLREAAALPRRVGEAHLYTQFGLVPMLKDLLFLLKMQEKIDKKVNWLRKQNGKAYRRKVTLDSGGFSENVVRNIATTSSMYPSLSSFLYAPGQSTTIPIPVLKTYQRRIWYVAKYRFHIPELTKDPRMSKPSRMLIADLLGLSADPAIIYKLTPWSWLLDWFTSVGDVLSNVYARSVYHVVAEYAYVMCREDFTYQAPGFVKVHTGTSPFKSADDKSFSGVTQTKYEFRQRAVANPYGFGITYASLSGYQWSILAALGLSRGSKHSAPRP